MRNMDSKKILNTNNNNCFVNTFRDVSYIDFIGKKAELLIGSDKRNKTILGGILSFFIYAIIFIGFLYFGQEIAFKEIPSVILSSIIDDSTFPIVIDKDNFNFLFSLKDFNGKFINMNSEFIDIQVNNVKWNNNKTIIGNENSLNSTFYNKTEMRINDCDMIYKNAGSDEINYSESKYSGNNRSIKFENLVNNLNKKNYKCLAEKTEIFGSSETNQLAFLEININSCLDLFAFLSEKTGQKQEIIAEKVFKFQNNILSMKINNSDGNMLNSTTINIKELIQIFNLDSHNQNLEIEETFVRRKICPIDNLNKNISQITDKNSYYNINKNLINNSIFIFKYIETYFDNRSFSKLASYVIEEYKSIISTSFFKQADFNLKKIDYYTDKGLIMEDFEITSYSQLTKTSESFNNVVLSNIENGIDLNPLFKLILSSNKIRETYFRKYYKVQNLIAELGGLLKSFATMALILNYFNNYAKYYERMIGELFDVDDLFKYYQYYNSKNKTIFKKYRDSILLRNTKNMDNFKKRIVDHHAQNSQPVMKTRLNLTKEMLESSFVNFEAINKNFNGIAQRENNSNINPQFDINQMKNHNIQIYNIPEKRNTVNTIPSKPVYEYENYNSYNNLKDNKDIQMNPNCIDDTNQIFEKINFNSNNNFNNLHNTNNIFFNNANSNINPELLLNSLQNKNNKNIINVTDNTNNINNNVELNDYYYNQNNVNQEVLNENSFSSISSNQTNKIVKGLRKNEKLKENFYKLKKKRFSLNMIEMIKINCCLQSEKITRKKQMLSGGKSMIQQKLDIIHILKKNLEFDRFKNLMLRDYQLSLLNSLSKFMLDPEKLNLVDFKKCNYDKFIDSYEEALDSQSIFNINLIKLIDNKFQIDKYKEN